MLGLTGRASVCTIDAMRKEIAAITPSPIRETTRAGIRTARRIGYVRARVERPLGTRPPVYLAVAAIFKNEAPYLAEWVTFHRMMGVERFWLYDNRSTDDWRAAIAPECRAGLVEVIPWAAEPGQFPAYAACLKRRRRDARWIAFIDIDEFLFSPTGRRLPDVLQDFDTHPGVVASWRVFGTGGHEIRPRGLVTESYLMRAADHREANHLYKSIVYPRKTQALATTPHAFQCYGRTVDENQQPVNGVHRIPPTADLLRINHYFTKSTEELQAKIERGRSDLHERRTLQEAEFPLRYLNEVRDGAILPFVPALKDALAHRPTGLT